MNEFNEIWVKRLGNRNYATRETEEECKNCNKPMGDVRVGLCEDIMLLRGTSNISNGMNNL